MTQLQRVKISALGTYVPPRLLTNADLEKLVDTNDQWIMERVGIRERHLVEKGVATSDLAVEAAKKALAQRGIRPSEIDDHRGNGHARYVFPLHRLPGPTQAWRQGRLGLRSFGSVFRVCLCLETGAQFIASGAHKKVLVIGADVMSSIIDYTDRATCVIFGDGAGAVILEPAEDDWSG